MILDLAQDAARPNVEVAKDAPKAARAMQAVSLLRPVDTKDR